MNFAYGPFVRSESPPAPVGGLNDGMRRALVAIFFAGEMDRDGRHFVADGAEPITGITVERLIVGQFVRLCVERHREAERRKIVKYRYYVKLTPRGEWYATTLITLREANTDALAPDHIDDCPTVYADDPELTP